MSTVLVAAAGVLTAVAVAVRPGNVESSFRSTVPPFLEVGGIVVIGWIAVRLGAIERVTGRWRSLGRTGTIVAVLVLTVLLSGLANLDVAVGIAIPVGIALAVGAGIDAGLLAIAIAIVANAASFLLPTSNLTNLLVMQPGTIPAGDYVRWTWIAWLGVCVVTVAVLVVLVARRIPSDTPRVSTGTWSLWRIGLDLAAMFAIAVSLRALLTSGWTLPGGFATQTLAGSLIASTADNLPMAVIVHGGAGLGPWTAMLGMSVGANLFLIGSVATVICRRLAVESGVRFSLVTFTVVGAALLPIQLTIAYVGLRLSGALAR